MRSPPNEYEAARKEAEAFYFSLSRVFCPAIQEMVSFTSAGFNHIRYKKGGVARDQAFQLQRFKLLPQVLQLVTIATTFQEYEEVRKIRYWGIIAILNNRKIKVVIRKLENGPAHFWSIMPTWVTSAKRDTRFLNKKKIL